MKYIITESQINKVIDKFITYQFEPHEVKKSSEYPDSIFWVKDGEVIVEIEDSDYFWVSPQIWENIRSMFSLKYSETQQVIRDWLEEHYKLGGLTPYDVLSYDQTLLEEHYKLGGLTPYDVLSYDQTLLEEHYKVGGLTPTDKNTVIAPGWKHIKLD
jgi:hypothetical protein